MLNVIGLNIMAPSIAMKNLDNGMQMKFLISILFKQILTKEAKKWPSEKLTGPKGHSHKQTFSLECRHYLVRKDV